MRQATQPKKASTVILVRPNAHGQFELFLTRRPAEMHFLGGMYVFPGGSVKKEDCSEGTLRCCRGVTKKAAQKTLGMHLSPNVALGHWVAAIRELFEEVGILFCVNAVGKPVDMAVMRERLAGKRRTTMKGSMEFREILESEKIFCDLARLHYFSHWRTPEEFPTRFDTRFYLAPLPQDQNPFASSEEVTHSLWITPDRALELSGRGSLPVIFPTFASLRTLANFDSFESLFAVYQPSKPD